MEVEEKGLEELGLMVAECVRIAEEGCRCDQHLVLRMIIVFCFTKARRSAWAPW